MTSAEGLPAALLCSLSISAAVANTLLPAIALAFRPSGSAAAPMRSTCALLGLGLAARVERLERRRGRAGHVAALGEQDRRAQGQREEHAGRDAVLPRVGVDQGHGAGPGHVGGAGEHGLGHGGGVGHRVGAAHARGVAGGEGREAELLGRLWLGALLADLGRGGRGLVPGFAAARDDDEGSAGKDERGEGTAGHPGRA